MSFSLASNGFKAINFKKTGLKCLFNLTNNRNASTNMKIKQTSVVRSNFELVKPKYQYVSYALSDTSNLHLLNDTLSDRIEMISHEKPNDIAYKFCLTQKSFTFLEISQRVNELAQNLLKMGFKKGDRLAVMLPNIPETNLAILAASSIGVIVVLMNPAYQLVEIEYMLKKTGSKGLIMLDNLKTIQHYEILKKICPELEGSTKGELNSNKLPDLKHVIVVNSGLTKPLENGYKGTWNFKEMEKSNSAKLQKPVVDSDDSMVILFTSGTTGLPKGAVLSHYNLLNSAYLEIYTSNLVKENKIIACPIPVFHSFGLIVGVISPFICGSKAVFPSFLPDTSALIKAIHNEKCTAIKGAPIIFIDLINHPDRKNYDLSSLEYMLVGASTVPKDILLKMKHELKLKHIIIGCGMTESSAGGLITRTTDLEISEKYAYESIGQPLPFVECKIIDEKGNTVPHNTDGEICFRGYNIMKEYWNDPDKTAQTIDNNGWLKTGDIASMDEHGYVYFKSRQKEIIIRGGVNIYPAEIEAFLRTNDQIIDAYCFGIEDSRTGEEVCVWIKKKENSDLTQEKIIEFCKEKIAFFKIPKYIKFVNAFPINANGKVQKFKMQEQMKIELSKK